jgi:hypothetical protein
LLQRSKQRAASALTRSPPDFGQRASARKPVIVNDAGKAGLNKLDERVADHNRRFKGAAPSQNLREITSIG